MNPEKDSLLRVGIYEASAIPQSFRVYAANVRRHFPALGIEEVPFSDPERMPRQVDVLWDIRSGGGNAPLEFMLGGPPLVITVHGFAPISLSGWEYFRTLKGVVMSRRWARKKYQEWLRMKDGVSALIAVSEFSRGEATQYTGMDATDIHVCHHGVEAGEFSLAADGRHDRYFLHVSNNEPRKNLNRVVRAFSRLGKSRDMTLLLKLPKDQARRFEGLPGVRVMAGMLSTAELAELYRRALGFVFPSLYEGFGMPILEAMASGCPVITSNVTACPEVAGNAALTVDPRDEDALYRAMATLADDALTRDRLAAAGLVHYKTFDWQASAACHAQVLARAADHYF